MSFKSLMQSLLGLFVPRNSLGGSTEKLVYGVSLYQFGESNYPGKVSISLESTTETDQKITTYTATTSGYLFLSVEGNPVTGGRIEKSNGIKSGFIRFYVTNPMNAYFVLPIDKGETATFYYTGSACTASFVPYKQS